MPKKISLYLGGGLTALMVFVWPLAMLETVVQDQGTFLSLFQFHCLKD